jgi:hypothetical protein
MTETSPLLRVSADFRPFLLEADEKGAASAINGWLDSGLVVRTVRGRKMRSRQGLFDEFAAALQFPPYFGENEDAFNECIADLEVLPRQAGFVVVVTEPEQVLIKARSVALAWLADSLRGAAEEWSRPVELGEWWDRPAYPFHVVLLCELGAAPVASERWVGTGLEVVRLDG